MITRRKLIAGASATAALSTVPATVRGQALNLRVRKNIGSLSPNDPIIQTYRRAVTRMMALPLTDRRNWFRQARIHNDACPHGNWFFPPWHREYLRRFEEIIREVAQEPSFDLPFWDWNSSRQIPASFWGDNNNPLNPANLDFRPFAQADAEFAQVLSALGNARALAPTRTVGNDTDFSLTRRRTRVFQASTFVGLASAPANALRPGSTQSYLENILHGNVHNDIGGQMGAFFSPLDPIFWLHHANVDRLWSLWQRRNPTILPPTNWRNFPLPAGMFSDGQGNGAPPVACGGLETTHALGYTYEAVPSQEQLLLVAAFTAFNASFNASLSSTGPAAPTTPPQTKTFVAEAPADNRTSDRTFAAVNVPVQPTELPEPQVLAALEAGFSPITEPIVAYLTLAELPKIPDARYRVFINCDYLSPGTPRADPSYVSTISLFGVSHESHDHEATGVLKVDLGDAVAALDRSQRPRREQLTIQVQPEPLRGQQVASSIAFRRAEVSVTKA
jgi:tyrosinase